MEVFCSGLFDGTSGCAVHYSSGIERGLWFVAIYPDGVESVARLGRVPINSPCPLYPQKRTLQSATRMSALCQKRKSPQSDQIIKVTKIKNS